MALNLSPTHACACKFSISVYLRTYYVVVNYVQDKACARVKALQFRFSIQVLDKQQFLPLCRLHTHIVCLMEKE